MRQEGTLKVWHDDRGFGFIAPRHGGQDVFVHIRAFKLHGLRPHAGLSVSFELETGPDGRKRAKAVQLLRTGPALRAWQNAVPPRHGATTLLAIPAFLLFYVVAAALWHVPNWVALAYWIASPLTYAVYASDKSAAQAERQRVSESTLLTLGLLCGWPGGIVAQQILRHKSTKAAFRSRFWATVILNIAAFVALLSPAGKALLGLTP